MAKKMRLEPHLSTEELENRYRKAKDPVERSHYQIVWLISEGKTTREVMEATGYGRNWIQRLSRRYNERGPEALGDKRHHNPGAKDSGITTVWWTLSCYATITSSALTSSTPLNTAPSNLSP